MEQAKEYALGDDDITKLLGGGIKITSYPNLDKVQHLDDVFDQKGRAILFFPQENQQSGHWCAMIKKGREIEFFDPYGEPPEAQKDGLSSQKLQQLRMDKPLLADLLDQSGYRIIFNKVQLQKLNDCVNTCGRHCVARLLYAKYPIKRYREIIERSGCSPDDYVTKLTYEELGK